MRVFTKVLISAIVSVVIASGTSFNCDAAEEYDGIHIPPNITIDGVDVSGLTLEEANNLIKDSMDSYHDLKFTLKANHKSVEATGKDINIIPLDTSMTKKALEYGSTDNLIARYKAHKDIQSGKGKDFKLTLTADHSSVKTFLEGCKEEINTEPVNNGLKRENGGFTFIEGSSGVMLNIDESANLVAEYISNEWKGGNDSIDLAADIVEPKGTREELQGVKDLLGGYHTNFSSSTTGRAANVRNGASRINGTLLFPGDSLSVDKALGKRNAENGYHLAPSYENGTSVDTYGGGICQVSTTLYNAVILAELDIEQRYAHSMVVNYVKPSMDAAISEGSKDFVFRNNLETPIYIEGYTAGYDLYFNIFGKETRPKNRTVSFESEVLSKTEPHDTFVPDGALPAGTIVRTNSAHTGYTARLWKIVKVDGKEDKKLFNNSSYRVSNAVYNVGIAGDSGSIQAAIATQDRGAIEAAASSGGGGHHEPSPEPEAPPITEGAPEAPIEPGI